METQAAPQIRGRRTRRCPEERRTQILEEALRFIGERGFYGFSIRKLARRCGMTDPGLLHHFNSKEKLLVALLEVGDRIQREAMPSIVDAPSDICAEPLSYPQVLDLLRGIVLRSADQPEFVKLYAVLQAEALQRDHPAHNYFVAREAAALDGIVQMIRPYVSAPRSTAVQLLALIKGLELEWLRSDQALDIVGEWDAALMRLMPQRSYDPSG